MHWVHKCCSGLNSRLDNVDTYLNPTVANEDDKMVRLGNIDYWVADELYDLGYMLSVHGGASHIRSGWKKFRELLPLLTSRVCIRRKVSYIALVSVVSCCMAAKPSH